MEGGDEDVEGIEEVIAQVWIFISLLFSFFSFFLIYKFVICKKNLVGIYGL
jgi:hypothetical protein